MVRGHSRRIYQPSQQQSLGELAIDANSNAKAKALQAGITSSSKAKSNSGSSAAPVIYNRFSRLADEGQTSGDNAPFVLIESGDSSTDDEGSKLEDDFITNSEVSRYL